MGKSKMHDVKLSDEELRIIRIALVSLTVEEKCLLNMDCSTKDYN